MRYRVVVEASTLEVLVVVVVVELVEEIGMIVEAEMVVVAFGP